MATNEELSIAFLCLATRQQQSELIEYVQQKYPAFLSSENGLLFMEAVNMPFTEIPRKIAKLGASLGQFEHKQGIYLWMADRLAAICHGAREPLPLSRRKESAHYDAHEHVLHINLVPSLSVKKQ